MNEAHGKRLACRHAPRTAGSIGTITCAYSRHSTSQRPEVERRRPQDNDSEQQAPPEEAVAKALAQR
jgi:hypothetical protein